MMFLVYEFLDLEDYHNASVAFREPDSRIERKIRFDWAKRRFRRMPRTDGKCMVCATPRAALIQIEPPRVDVLSHYCYQHAKQYSGF